MRLPIVLVAIALLCPSVSSANDQDSPSLAEIRIQQIEYRSQALANQGTFKDITPRVRNELVAKQTEFIDITEGKQSLDELSRDDQMRAINTLEWIKAAVTKAENERIVCERVKVVGSNRPQRVCRTVGEMRSERDAAVKVMEERSMCGTACRGN